MKKADAEKLVRAASGQWANSQVDRNDPNWHPNWCEFKEWLLLKFPDALTFRSVAGADYDAESWFDDELGQNWRR